MDKHSLQNLEKTVENNEDFQINKKVDYVISRSDFNIHELCRCLSYDTIEFDKEHTYDLIKRYIGKNKNNRIRYSGISEYIYHSDDLKRVHMLNNIEELYKYALRIEISRRNNKINKEKQTHNDDSAIIRRVIFKLWDHIELATSQFSIISNNKEKFEENFHEIFDKEKEELSNKIDESNKSVTSQLISMVAIFTAMAFLVFGGLNSLSDILSASIQGVPVLNISIVCLLWGLCVYNMIYLFMYLVSKLISKNIASRDSKHIFRRHIIYFSGNIVLFILLLVVGWLYFVKCDFRGWYTALYGIFLKNTPYLGFVLLGMIIILIIVFYIIIRKIDNTKENSTL